MRVPVWLTLGAAILVCVFGAYRIRLGFRSDEEDQRARARKGLYAMGRRTHVLIGIVYLLLGGALVATSFGWNPFGNLFGPTTAAPSPSGAPAKASPALKTVPSTTIAPAHAAPTSAASGVAAEPPAQSK